MAKKILKKKRPVVAGRAEVDRRITRFRSVIYTRHPSHGPLRDQLPLLPFRSLVRLGSTTDKEDTVTNGGRRVECNTITGVRNSADKLLMKQCFDRAGVKTAVWAKLTDDHKDRYNGIAPPWVVKHRMGSRGTGNTLLGTFDELQAWNKTKSVADLSNYIIEKFHAYSREYRIHVIAEGYFYTCRKMLKENTPEEERWHRHDENSVWILESNADFNKPVNWDVIVADCVKALNGLGLDIGAFDVKVQSANDKKGRPRVAPEYIIIESCSAPSFGDVTLQKYIAEIPKVLKRKFANQ